MLQRGTAAGAAMAAFPATSVAARSRANPLIRDGRFGHGVASGFPSPDGAALWTRLDGLELPRGKVRVEVARDPGFRKVVARRLVRVSGNRDHTARIDLRSSKLSADEEYWYRFETRRRSSPVGRFKTLPPFDSRRPIRFAFFSCQRYEHGYFTPHAGIAADEDLDFVLSLGDYIYEEDADPKLDARFDPSGQPNGHVEKLEQFRSRHATYRSDADLQRMHSRHAVISIWDDCEIEGNWAGDGPSSGPSPVGERAIPFEAKRLNGMRAYFEWMPYGNAPRGSGRIEAKRLYQRVRLGRTAELFLLDTRKYRDPQPCEDSTFESGPCPDDASPQPRERLGPEQKEWLKRGLVDSQADWKILGNAQMMMALDIAPGQPVSHDAWDGYAVERREVLEHARAQGVRNLTSVVGDVHVFFAGELRTDGRTTGQPLGTEFVGTSVSHDALALPGLTEEESATLTNQIKLANPHLSYANFRHRGYAVMEARPAGLTVDFRRVSTVLEPEAAIDTLASFEVASGSPRLVQTLGSRTNMAV